VAARLEEAARERAPEPEHAAPRVPVGATAEESLADDPAYRRRLAARAAMAVALGAAVGVVGAAWGRRRS
jgi:hypothetical protein